jgi:hypothetical protein
MDDIEKRARAIWLLAVAHRAAGLVEDSNLISLNISCGIDHAAALRAIIAALTPPEGFVLVPVEPTYEMVEAGLEAHMPFGDMELAIQAAIAARPSASP